MSKAIVTALLLGWVDGAVRTQASLPGQPQPVHEGPGLGLFRMTETEPHAAAAMLKKMEQLANGQGILISVDPKNKWAHLMLTFAHALEDNKVTDAEAAALALELFEAAELRDKLIGLVAGGAGNLKDGVFGIVGSLVGKLRGK